MKTGLLDTVKAVREYRANTLITLINPLAITPQTNMGTRRYDRYRG